VGNKNVSGVRLVVKAKNVSGVRLVVKAKNVSGVRLVVKAKNVSGQSRQPYLTVCYQRSSE
jgi:hypothetical protein